MSRLAMMLMYKWKMSVCRRYTKPSTRLTVPFYPTLAHLHLHSHAGLAAG